MRREQKIVRKKTGNKEDADLMKRLRRDLGISQAKIGKLLGISSQQVWNIEHKYNALSKYVKTKIELLKKTDDDEKHTTTIPLLPSFPAGLHSLRHSFAVNALRAGIPIRTVQKWLDHESVKTTMRYLAFTDDMVMSDMERLPGL